MKLGSLNYWPMNATANRSHPDTSDAASRDMLPTARTRVSIIPNPHYKVLLGFRGQAGLLWENA